MWQSLFWLLANAVMIAWHWHTPNSTTKGVVMTMLTASTLINLVALYVSLHT